MQFKHRSHHIFKIIVILTPLLHLGLLSDHFPTDLAITILYVCSVDVACVSSFISLISTNRQYKTPQLRKTYRRDFSQIHTVGIILLSYPYKLQSFTDRKPSDCRTTGMIIFRSVLIWSCLASTIFFYYFVHKHWSSKRCVLLEGSTWNSMFLTYVK